MCVDDCTDKSGRGWILLLWLLSLIVSLGVAVSMGILMYPGFDECLLFVGVRGEALIYGNPHGCNFMIVGHCCILLLGIVMLYLLFARQTKGFVRRNNGSRSTLSKRPFNGVSGVPSAYSSNPTALQNWNRVHGSSNGFDTGRLSKHYSASAIGISMLLATFSLLTALVCLSGYLVTCDELSYEATRQIHGRTTLGTPVRQLSIHCWSLFRDNDFHMRFHYDHLEYSGQWHGQYRGYKHGRVHSTENNHEHVIGVAEALEICMAGAWISSVIWIAIMSLLIHLRRKTKKLEKRELAESLEDARIFASSRHIMDGGFPHPAYSQQTIPLNSRNGVNTPNDQVSMISSNSHAIKQPYSRPNSNASFATPYATLDLSKQTGAGVRPRSMQAQSIAGYPAQMPLPNQQPQPTMKTCTSGPILHQQQILLTQQMQQMQQLQQQQQQNGSTQYVQLSNGLLVPTSSIATPTTVAAPVDISASLIQSQMVAATNHQLQQQQIQISQQLQQAQSKKQLQNTQPQTPQDTTMKSPEKKEAQTPNSPKAQMEQLGLSNDVGMKCSQI